MCVCLLSISEGLVPGNQYARVVVKPLLTLVATGEAVDLSLASNVRLSLETKVNV